MFPVRKTKTERQFGAGAIAVCISWFNLIWFLRRIPDLGTYILTLQKVFTTLLKVIGTAAPIVLQSKVREFLILN